MKFQKTIKSSVSISGIGLHSGKRVSLTLSPARSNSGIRFQRLDSNPSVSIEALVKNVHSTNLATTIAKDGVSVSTIEHLMSALWSMGIDNILCQVDGSELPILDGSALPFVQLIKKAGIKTQRSLKKVLVVKKEIEVKHGDKWAVLKPANDFKIRYTIDFPHPVIGKQTFEYSQATDFVKEIAPCRTFGFLKDVEKMQAMGLALGGSLQNAVVLDDVKALNEEGLRFSNEFVRHKILDAIGDFSLVGYSILGSVELNRAGHELQTKLIHELLSQKGAYVIVAPEESEQEQSIELTEAAYA
ncbi:MAG: UDP-3-O-acyl-N-acetylglucosamine deacetylase [Oligoflexia bacterium]|nr:UDP-3-O-acyl-N-acetylglucosamine deacetylase [Oligoflexia bacterium]